MQSAGTLILELRRYSLLLLQLRDVDPDLAATEIAPGKWSIHDLVAHIMMWDRNFVENTGPRLLAGHSVLLAEDTDGQAFNDRAAAYGRTLDHQKLLDEAIRYRSELLTQLSQLPTEAFEKSPIADAALSLATFLQQMFVSHDQHHMTQIESYLENHGVRTRSK